MDDQDEANEREVQQLIMQEEVEKQKEKEKTIEPDIKVFRNDDQTINNNVKELNFEKRDNY